MSCVVAESVVISPVISVEAEVCAVDYSQFSKIQLQVNDVNQFLLETSPFNICIVNTNGLKVGESDAEAQNFSNLEVDLEVDL